MDGGSGALVAVAINAIVSFLSYYVLISMFTAVVKSALRILGTKLITESS